MRHTRRYSKKGIRPKNLSKGKRSVRRFRDGTRFRESGDDGRYGCYTQLQLTGGGNLNFVIIICIERDDIMIIYVYPRLMFEHGKNLKIVRLGGYSYEHSAASSLRALDARY